MSFILDALKKLERHKQKENGASGGDVTVMEGGRRWGETKRRFYLGWGGITLALAALIVAVTALYQSRSADAPAHPESEPVGVSPQLEAAERESIPSTSPSVDDRPTASQNVQRTEQESPKEPEPEGAQPILEEEIESAPPVRLVGTRAGERTSPEPSSEGEEVSGEIPEGLPELVLQGTSVVDGKPVAVINYQRLFVGDMIEGARITRIADRLVELEYEGKRFVIKL